MSDDSEADCRLVDGQQSRTDPDADGFGWKTLELWLPSITTGPFAVIAMSHPTYGASGVRRASDATRSSTRSYCGTWNPTMGVPVTGCSR